MCLEASSDKMTEAVLAVIMLAGSLNELLNG